ncbi:MULTISPECIES: ABC transporter permease [unclassified Treponema]|uniref:ABC transporter permease n=1 Tax=unclassified Treponema TaxID=2638727 RepID=UPI0020A2C582|nr:MULTISPECIES: ABC transporter permease [unclassified Treponema]UTC65932.1 ABC transporter permease [Treponema sp. OMZ 789]UTC68660.1 ABC transporter permease [Treponema sp. OMZ 790]UTC71390.1 ABC transporter permease [Treponema sp. OMZ 791]
MKLLLLKKLLITIPYLLAITALSFSVVYFAPGESTAKIILKHKLSGAFISEAQAEQYAAEQNLNIPFKEAYFNWLKGILKGDLGNSLITGDTVVSEIAASFSKTLLLSIIALFTEICISFPLAMYTAWKNKSFLNKLTEIWGICSMSIPFFWLGLLVVWICTAKLKLLFVVGYQGIKSLVIPGLLLGIMGSGYFMQIIKSKTSLILQESYIELAKAQGLSVRKILFGHVLKNISAPCVAILAINIIALLGGSVLIEKIFSIPGFGLLMFNASENKDYILLSGGILFTGTIVLTINFFADIYYLKMDRRAAHELYAK